LAATPAFEAQPQNFAGAGEAVTLDDLVAALTTAEMLAAEKVWLVA
jgi:hypothetical protein